MSKHRRKPQHYGPDDFRKLSQEQAAAGRDILLLAEEEMAWRDILQRRTQNRINFDLHLLAVADYNDLFFQFLQDRYQQRCSVKNSWVRFDKRLDDLLGPEQLDYFRWR